MFSTQTVDNTVENVEKLVKTGCFNPLKAFYNGKNGVINLFNIVFNALYNILLVILL